MPSFPKPTFETTNIDRIAGATGTLAICLQGSGKMDKAAARVNRLTRGAVVRVAESESFARLDDGGCITLDMPAGLAADRLVILRLERNAPAMVARRAGAALAKALRKEADLRLELGALRRPAEVVYGLALRAYAFDAHKTGAGVDKSRSAVPASVTVAVNAPEGVAAQAEAFLKVAEGVHLARDLTNEPSNILTTTEFAARLESLRALGVTVEVLEEDALETLGMRTLLAVGQGSRSPTKLVVMQWSGGPADTPPLALVGKGVVFDTGGISLKPPTGMEEMTMDMGGAAVVAGAIHALAARKAKANVVGLVGLVENMPDGNAQRPGDVVTSMKGDTIEVINTDAEGRLVLADVLWYARDRFSPSGIVDLATLTGAVIIGLGHHNAGVFSNDDTFVGAFLKAANAEEEGAWRLPLGKAYDKALKSRVADMANVGGRPGGAVIAAQFLQRFVKEGTPWIHLDIAGVASVKFATDFAPSGATGWGVRTLDRMIRDTLEG